MSEMSIKFSIADDGKDGRFHDQGKSDSLPSPPVSRVARMLALAHHVQQLVDEGKLRDYAHAAEVLGITRARMTQIEGLLLLSPSLQASILSGELEISERRLRHVLHHAVWQQQEVAVRCF